MTQCDDEARSHPKLCRLFDYWFGKCRLDRLPSKADIDPVDIPDILPHVVLWDVIEGGRDYRVRLAGTGFEAAYGRGLRDARMSHLVDEGRICAPWDRLARVVHDRSPDFSSGVLVDDIGGKPRRFVRVVLPLACDGGEVNCLLSAYVFRRNGP
jgi:hypothetical protein